MSSWVAFPTLKTTFKSGSGHYSDNCEYKCNGSDVFINGGKIIIPRQIRRNFKDDFIQ